MKRMLYFPVLILLLFVQSMHAQDNPEFRVTSFTHESNNLAARINQRPDANDEPCALVLVRTAETGLGFTGSNNVVGQVQWKNGDYWVYVSGGTRTLKIYKQGIKTVEYRFDPVPRPKETYLLVLDVVRPKPKISVWPVTLIVRPENATLTIDGNKVDIQQKTHKLAEGTHTVKLEMQGYQPLEKTITGNDKIGRAHV